MPGSHAASGHTSHLCVSPPSTAPDQAPSVEQTQARWFAEKVQPHDSSLKAYLRGSFPTVRDVDDTLQEMDVRLQRRHRRRVGAVAGGLAALLVAGFVWYAAAGRRPTTADSPSVSSVVVSRPARQVLPDGSVVELKDGAEIALDYNAALRRVALKRGEAHFQVAKNKERPFVVEAAGVEVRAVGTAFSVQLGSKQVEVLVTEGRVAVAQPAQAVGGILRPDLLAAVRQPLAVVDAGNRLVVDLASPSTPSSAPQAQVVPPAELTEQLAWRAPRLEFSGTPLAEAIPLVNHHSHVRLVLADPELGQVRLSGVLRADNIDTLLRLLEEAHGIKTERSGDAITLSKAK